MFYYLYEIRNNLNDKIYVGVHKTTDMDDGYMGSGKILLRAISKNGIENFTKTILETFATSEQMYAREKEVVTDEFLLREDVYNLRRGGTGGFDYINRSGITKFKGKQHSEETKRKTGHPGNKHGLGNQGGKKNKGLKRDKKLCPHCNTSCAVNMYARLHGDRCKLYAGKVLVVTRQSSKL